MIIDDDTGETYDEGTILGGKLPEENFEWKPALSGMGPEKIVAVFNPLSKDFRVIYTRSVAVNAPLSPQAQYAREKAGLDLSKRGVANQNVMHSLILKSGETKNLPGDIAQKAVQDLITCILGIRTGHKRTADPYSRGEVEKEIILSIRDATDFFNREPVVEDQKAVIDQEIETINKPFVIEKDVPNPPPGKGAKFESKKAATPKA